MRAQVPDADPEDVVLLYDLLGIRDPDVALPNIDPDARRRRLSALINSVSLARTEPALYIIEDAHWIDDVSESIFADFLTVIPQTHSTVLITYRPEYRGTLAHVPVQQRREPRFLVPSCHFTQTVVGRMFTQPGRIAPIV